MNPLFYAMNNMPINANIPALIKMLQGKDPQAFAQMLSQNNPRFAQFLQENKGKSIEEIAKNYGINLSQIQNLMK